MDIKEHIKILKSYEKNKQRALIRTRLSHKEIVSFCDKFLDTKDSKVTNQILESVAEIIKHCKTLYDLDRYVLPYSDDYYDQILCKFKRFKDEVFGYDSIGLSNVKYKYETLAGTLDKVHTIFASEKTSKKDERPSLEEWLENPIIKNEIISIFINRKEDGTSIVAEMELVDKTTFKAVRGISRGRKDYGEGADVTPVVKGLTFDGSDLYDSFGFIPSSIGIQYEMVVTDKDREKLEKYRGLKFANNRSAATGLMRKLVFAKKEEAKELRKFVSLVPVGFEMIKIDRELLSEYTWSEIFVPLCKTFIHGNVDTGYKYFKGKSKEILKDVRKYANEIISGRDELNHDIDGLVMTILNSSIQKKLGRKNNINKWQVAFKFPEQVKKTKIVGLIETTGLFGYKEFLAEVEPVLLNGTKQNKGQFHSLDRFNSFKPRIGDEVYLKLSGDVIPYMYTDDTCKKGDGEKLKLPAKCECGHDLVEENNKLRCPNKLCKYRVIGWLVTFLTEVNAKGIGEETCVKLYKELNIDRPSKLLKLTKSDFRKLEGFGKESANLAEETIHEILNNPRKPEVILSSLGIDSFRKSTAEKVLSDIPLSELIEMSKLKERDKLIKKLKKVYGIDENASTITDGLIERIDELEKLLSVMSLKEKKEKTKDAKIILVSGLRNNKDLESIADEHNFIIKDSGKTFDILIIKDESYLSKPKAILAQKINKEIYSLGEFLNKYER